MEKERNSLNNCKKYIKRKALSEKKEPKVKHTKRMKSVLNEKTDFNNSSSQIPPIFLSNLHQSFDDNISHDFNNTRDDVDYDFVLKMLDNNKESSSSKDMIVTSSPVIPVGI
jgi:hypothetical protein